MRVSVAQPWLSSFYASAQAAPKIDVAVKACVHTVHSTKINSQYWESSNRQFAAHYSHQEGLVLNNADQLGDQQALNLFNQCMYKQGVPLS